jgi:deoxyadenosine/deoxycytidine kinase
MANKLRVIIEGNIGSGKTTCLDMLESNENFEVIREPVDIWLNIKGSNGKNLLQEFYEDPNRYSYLFQSMVFKTRLQSIDHVQDKLVRFCERSIWTDRYVFGSLCINSGKMNEIEINCYKYWFKWLEDKFHEKRHAIIYLRCSPEKCYEIMCKRARNEENSVPLEYLQELHKYHEDWINNWKQTPVLIIDNDQDDNWDNILNKINSFIIGNSIGVSMNI